MHQDNAIPSLKQVFPTLLVLFFLVFGLFSTAAAQTAAPKLKGSAVDSKGDVLVGAMVTLLTTSNTMLVTTTTDSRGEFVVTPVPAGTYLLKVESRGFQPFVQVVHLSAGADMTLPVRLSIESVASEITVTPARGAAQETFNTPESTNIVSAEDIAQKARVLLPQALREQAGVHVQQTTTSQGAVFLHGLTGQQVVHLVDGIRFNNATFRPGPNQYFSLIEPSFANQIEVVRGPNSSQYGSDSLGGTVNILTVPAFTSGTGLDFRGNVTNSFASADLSIGSSALFSLGTRKLSLVFGGAGRRAQDLRTGGGVDSRAAITRFLGLPSTVTGENRLQDTAFTQYGYHGKLVYSPRPDQHVTVNYMRATQLGVRRFDQLDGGNGNLINSFTPQVLDFFYTRYEKMGLGFLDSLVGTFSFNSQRDDRQFQGGAGNRLAAVTSERNIDRALGYTAQATTHIGRRQSIVFGGEIYDEYIDSTRSVFRPATGVFDQNVRARFPDGTRYTTYGLFAQDMIEVVPGRLRAVGGVRYSRFHYRQFAAKNPVLAGGVPSVPDFSTSIDDVTFNTGVLLQAAHFLNFTANVSRGFRAPNATDFGSIGLTSNGFEVTPEVARAIGAEIGNNAGSSAVSTGRTVGELTPESGFNYEFGAKVRTDRVSATFAVYDSEISDFIQKRTLIAPQGTTEVAGQRVVKQLPSGAVITAVDSRPVLVRVNAGEVRIYGFEASTRVVVHPGVTISASVFTARARDKEPSPTRSVLAGIDITGVPELEGGIPPTTGFLSLKWAPPGRRYWVEAYSTMATAQSRLSAVDVEEQRIAALRSRSSIASFFRNGATARGWVRNGRLIFTGETLAQVQDRVLGPGVDSAPLFRQTDGYVTLNFRGGYRIGERSDLIFILENATDTNYRTHGSGIDAPGVNFQVGYRWSF